MTTVTGGDTENGHFRYLIPSYFHIHSYTCIYVHIRAHTCFSHLVVFCPLHLHIRAYTCIYSGLHILAYTGIYWHIRAGGGGGLREGHALTPTASGIRVRVRHCVCQTLRVRLAVAACGCGLADSESADLKRHGPACASDAARARAVESLELERVELSTIIMPVSLAAAASESASEGTEPKAIQIRQWRSQTRIGQRPAVGKGQPLSKTEKVARVLPSGPSDSKWQIKIT